MISDICWLQLQARARTDHSISGHNTKEGFERRRRPGGWLLAKVAPALSAGPGSARFALMDLLVTGGAGFIGSNAIRRIIDRPEVTRLINVDCLTYAGHLESLRAVEKHPKYLFERVDLRDRRAVYDLFQRHSVSHVLHLAAESQVDRSIAAPDIFIQTNVNGAFHLLEGCRAAWKGNFEGKRFHHVSTDEVYGSLGP